MLMRAMSTMRFDTAVFGGKRRLKKSASVLGSLTLGTACKGVPSADVVVVAGAVRSDDGVIVDVFRAKLEDDTLL